MFPIILPIQKNVPKKSKQLSLDTSATVDLTGKKRKRLHETLLAACDMRETIKTRPESTVAQAQFDTTGMAVFAVFERPECHSLED